MINKKNVAQYCADNILKIPHALYYMRDVKVLAAYGKTAIFYKHLEQDLLDIEFYTNAACIVYVKNGEELITDANNTAIRLSAGESIFFPKGLNLFSDYTSAVGTLNAFLVFFERGIVERFLASLSQKPEPEEGLGQPYVFARHSILDGFFDSLMPIEAVLSRTEEVVNLKILELLNLLLFCDSHQGFLSCLSAVQKANPEQNIVRLMNKYVASRLSVAERA